MDSASQEIYFQRIEELVQDDDKIVTVSSLASDLGISVQNSRNIICKYLEDQRKLKPHELGATYVISGTLKENGKRGVFMVKENDLNEKKGLFETVPSEIIYSVQKNKNVDFNITALVDMFDSSKIRETALQGSIVSKNCIKRTLKFKKLPAVPPPTLKGKSLSTPKPEASKSSEKSTVSPKKDQKVKAGGIADLFKAAASQSKNANGSTSVKPATPAAKAKGLTAFLTNGALKPSKNNIQSKASDSTTKEKEHRDKDLAEESVEIEDSKEKTDGETKKHKTSGNSGSQNNINEEVLTVMDVDTDEESVEINKKSKVQKKASPSRRSQQRNSTQEKQKSNKRQRNKSKELPSKKRKRIIERNESDSDDMFEKDDANDDIIERSDEEPDRIPSPVVQTPVVPKNKRRKAVTKNYEDEEGFIVTKTEYVYETASEDENVEPEPPKQSKKEEPTVIKSKVAEKKKPAKNQATLMNFFKKK